MCFVSVPSTAAQQEYEYMSDSLTVYISTLLYRRKTRLKRVVKCFRPLTQPSVHTITSYCMHAWMHHTDV